MCNQREIALELLGILHGSNARPSNDRLDVDTGVNDFNAMSPFQMVTKSARYNVFQLVGRRVNQVDPGKFVNDGKNTSHTYPNPVRKRILEVVSSDILYGMEDRKNALSEINTRELKKSYDSTNTPVPVGNIIIYVENDKACSNIRLIIYGSFSTESRSDYTGGRLNPDDTIYFEISDNHIGQTTVDQILKDINTNAKVHDSGTAQNYNTIRSLVESVFKDDVHVMYAIQHNMLREIEVNEIIDTRVAKDKY